MADNKTRPTERSVAEFLNAVEHPVRRDDGWTVHNLMREVTGREAVMWGPSMVGFGSYHYRYDSGREGDSLAVGFSPRKANLALYGLTVAPGAAELLDRLGPHRTGAACLYVTRLSAVDLEVLAEAVRRGFSHFTDDPTRFS